MSKKLINGKILAIQLGRNETQLALIGKNSEILHGITVPTPMGAVEDGMIHNQEAITELLQQAMQTPEFKGVRQVVFSLCTSQVIMETTTTPDLPKAKLEKLIQANADMYFPVDIRDYRLVWEVVDVKKNDVGTKEASIQLWAVPNEMLRPYYQAANACGLSVAAIDYCGHSAATAVGATFARPAKPPKAKAAKDPAAPKEPKPKKKIDWNAEITFGKKKKVEPEVSQEEAGPRPIPATDMHILMDTELLGLTFVQEGQVVYQRFYRCGADPSYQFSELAMMLEYFQTQDIGRGSEIRGYVSGPGSMDADMVGLLSGMLGISLEAFQSEADPRWLLCTGAARSNLDFGNPEFNKTVRVRRTINTDLWQYASILVSGAALITVVLMLLNARLGWNSEISGLENQRNLLQIQAAKVSGFKDNYLSYESEYAAYDRDWENLFNSLHTYNDNLVFVLKELENVMPENTSVTDIIIDSDSVMISFACDDKEEAAYLIMSLRDMEYVDVNTISNLIGGGKGAATEYGTPIEEVTPPVEGGSLEKLGDYEPFVEEMTAAQQYSKIPDNKEEHTSLQAFLNRHPMSAADRIEALKVMIDTNPFAAKMLIEKVGFPLGNSASIRDIQKLVNGYKNQLDESVLKDAEAALSPEDAYLYKTYIHYLEAYIGLWGEIEDFKKYCPYVDQATVPELEELAKTVTPEGEGEEENYGAAWLYEWITECDRWPEGDAFCVCCKNIHLDTDNNEECDLCGVYICRHPAEKLTYTQIGNTFHTVTCDCGEVLLENVLCSDNGTGTCDCGRDVQDLCQHTDTTPPTPNNNGTSHSISCNECGEKWLKNCSDGNKDCICDVCAGEMLHGEVVITPTAGKDAHNYICNICKKEWQEQTPCADADGNELCDICGTSLAFTRLEIETLKHTHGKVPQPTEADVEDYEAYKAYMADKKLTYFEREAAIINLFGANAFAANDYIEEIARVFVPEYKIAEDAEFKTVQTAMETVKMYLQYKGVDENEKKLPQVEEFIFNTNDPEKYDIKTAYLYYLEVAMGRKADEHPHLIEKKQGNMDEKTDAEQERILATWEYVNNANKKMTKSRADYENFLYQYLASNKGDTAKLKKWFGTEMLADLEKYFDGADAVWEEKYEKVFQLAETDGELRKLLKNGFLLNYYEDPYREYDVLNDLITEYRNGKSAYATELLLVLQLSEREAGIDKDNKQDENIQTNKEEIDKLKKEMEALKKSAEEKAKEEEAAAGGAGGGSNVVGDTRVFLDIGLLYTEELWNQELQRKGLDRNAKVPKLELEVAG